MIYRNTSEVRAATGFEGEAVGDHGYDCLGLQGRWITVPKDLGSAKVLDHRTATTFVAASTRLRKLPANKEESGERSGDSRRPQFRRRRGFRRCVQAQGLASLV
ncbi:hypothetical protein U1Q18_025787 [Sarracenia purpurea var. burkii]